MTSLSEGWPTTMPPSEELFPKRHIRAATSTSSGTPSAICRTMQTTLACCLQELCWPYDRGLLNEAQPELQAWIVKFDQICARLVT